MKDFHIHVRGGVVDYEMMRKYIEKCIHLGMDEIVLLDHGNRTSPKHEPVLTDKKKIKEFLKNIHRARKEYKNIKIYSGIEVDYFFDKEKQEREISLMNAGFDYVLASIHGVKELGLDHAGYYQAMLDMVKTYPLQILAHLKLYDDYLEYDKMIRRILVSCQKKNVMVEINTSDRSIWNLEQMNYMFQLFREYGISYSIGSDAHEVGEIGLHYDLVYAYLNHQINAHSREIQYNIVSRGTEKAGSKGYMAVTSLINGQRYLLVQDHEKKEITTFQDSLNCYCYDIRNIAFSRFELIPALALRRIPFLDNVLLCGLGNVGIGALIYLLDHHYQNISIYIDSVQPYIEKMIEKLNQKYHSHIKIVEEMISVETYIDTTGVSSVIEEIFRVIHPKKTVFLIGTPRESTYLIDPLMIHRNNLLVIGGHELRGVNRVERLELFQKLLRKNRRNPFLKDIVHINLYRKNIFTDLLKEKKHFIEVVEYDDLC